MIGLLSAVPNIVGLIGLVLVSRHSDRTLERRYHSAFPCLTCASRPGLDRRVRE